MKKKINILIATLGILTLSSCNDFLNVSSPSQADTKFVFSNTEDAQKVLMGVYVKFCEDPYTSRMSNAWMQNTDVEAFNPNAGLPSGGHRSDLFGLQASADVSFSDIYNGWNNNYQAIDRANQVIDGIKSSAVSKDAEMQQMLGEAYCLKAYRYWMLCNFWGDVPYFDIPAKLGDELDKPKADKNIIYSKSLQDLVNIEGVMKFSDANTGGIERMNRDFALGLIARIALFRAGYGMTADGTTKRADDYLDVANNTELAVTYTDNDGNVQKATTYTDYYKMAKNYAQKLINLKPRALRSDFVSIFKDECQYIVKNNDEVLYEIAFAESYGGDVGWCIGVANTGTCANGNTTAQVGVSPLYYMSFADNDVRRDATCARYSNVNDTVAACGNVTNLFVGKWNRAWATKALGSGSSKGTGINWPLMRYSDVLLMLAEAENELNGVTDVAKLALKEVRARAFVNSPTYSNDVDGYVDSVAGSKDVFFKAIVNERAWEFGGECLRRFDLIRWNNYGEIINKAVSDLNNWSISTDSVLMSSVQSTYPNAYKFKNWADNLYYTKSGNKLVWVNNKYRVTDLTTVAGKYKVSWGTYLLKKVTTYTYNGVSYSKVTKTTNTDGTLTYSLDGLVSVTVASSDVTGIQKVVSYQAGDLATRLYRGYTGTAGAGIGPVPYLMPIGTLTLSSSKVLNNNGYGFSNTFVQNDVNKEFASVATDYK
ncbi:MAG: RagB/SusD family nutrient uptake outer membrane protein [Paludibacter sp.]|nr:RagB/SusD family nutrient uptake outer membrane protein [Paludibacter sp.]